MLNWLSGFRAAADNATHRGRVTVKQMRAKVQERLQAAGSKLTSQIHDMVVEQVHKETGDRLGPIPFVPANFIEAMLGQVISRHTAIMSELKLDNISDRGNLSVAERRLLELNSVPYAKHARDLVVAAYSPAQAVGAPTALGAVANISDLYHTHLTGIMVVHPLALDDKDAANEIFGHENTHVGQYARGLMNYKPERFKKSAWVQMQLMLEGQAFASGIAWMARNGQWDVMQKMVARDDPVEGLIRAFVHDIRDNYPRVHAAISEGKPIRDKKILESAILAAWQTFYNHDSRLYRRYIEIETGAWDAFHARNRAEGKVSEPLQDVPEDFWRKLGLAQDKIPIFANLGLYRQLDETRPSLMRRTPGRVYVVR